MALQKQRLRWTTPNVEATKAELKARLNTDGFSENPKARLNECFKIIQSLESEMSEGARLKLYVAIMSALVHHIDFGGIAIAKIEQLHNLAIKLLQLSGVAPEGSALSYLYGELYSVIGQIYWQEGDHLRGSWEQYLALRTTLHGRADASGYQYLAMAARLLRIGDLGAARSMIDKSYELGLQGDLADRAAILNLRLARLRRDNEATAKQIDASASIQLGDAFRAEFEWEVLCHEISTTANPKPMLQQVRRGEKFHASAYMIESVLWGLAVDSTPQLNSFPKLSTIRRSQRLTRTRVDSLLSIAEILQESYDTSFSLESRLDKIGSCIARISTLSSLDHELLCWLAMTRTIIRLRLHDHVLASMCLARYQALSLSISVGKSSDALCLAGDLLQASWFTERIK